MNQRYVDCFCSNFGSGAIMVLDKFFNASPIYKQSDTARTEYAVHMLWNNHFLYAKAKKDDPDVSCHYYGHLLANDLVLVVDGSVPPPIHHPDIFILF
jgi:hypothetical protein